jgi:dolichyl-phosphate-mannose--protein O-mannosyl transferase
LLRFGRRWGGPIAVTALAALTRFVHLSEPHELVFDETYYVKDAYSLMTHGYELSWGDDANAAFEAGDFSLVLDSAAYVVHPPVGKWLIGAGMWLFGPESSFGWRFSVALAGVLIVWLTILIGWRLFGSQPLGLLAGALVAVDGLALVLSRTALLDNFLSMFVMLALWLIMKDRALMDRRLEARLRQPVGHGPTGAPIYRDRAFGPGLGMRWYLLGAGVALGLACGTKWSGAYFLAVFGLLVVALDAAARYRLGIRHWLLAAVARDGVKAFVLTVPVAFAVYLASWSGWLFTSGGFFRDWAAQRPGQGVTWLPEALRSLLEYHKQAYSFHVGLTADHGYKSSPFGWLLQLRPTSFAWDASVADDGETVSRAVTALGNPLIWWLGIAALGLVIFAAVAWSDWRAWVILSGYLGGYVPWLFYAHRTVFTFYMVVVVPFLALALAYAAGRVIGRPTARDWSASREASAGKGSARLVRLVRARNTRVRLVAIGLALILLLSAFFWPIWTYESVPRNFWLIHMWFPSWV